MSPLNLLQRGPGTIAAAVITVCSGPVAAAVPSSEGTGSWTGVHARTHRAMSVTRRCAGWMWVPLARNVGSAEWTSTSEGPIGSAHIEDSLLTSSTVIVIN